MTDLEGKTAPVTGSTRTVRQATATALAPRGAHVLAVGRNDQRVEDAVASIHGGLRR